MNHLLIPCTAALVIALLAGATVAHSTPDPADNLTTASDEIVERALKKCAVCHGKKLEGKRKAPAIAGMTKAKVLKTLNNPPRQMKPVTKGLTAAQKRAVAATISKAPKAAPAEKPAKKPAEKPAGK